MTRAELKERAKSQIKGKLGTLFLMGLIICVITGLVMGTAQKTGGISGVVEMLVMPAFSLSFIMVHISLLRSKEIKVEDVFWGFNYVIKAFLVSFLTGLFVFLWSLLLVIPGIIKAYSYMAAPYILANNPELSALECIRLSKEKMNGHKFDMFVLQLSFFGWALLAPFTLGILYVWLIPYMNQTFVNFMASIGAVDGEKTEVGYTVEETHDEVVDNVAEIENKSNAELEEEVKNIVDDESDGSEE